MNIILINPDNGGRSRLMLPIPPYALASLAAVAKLRGHDVEVWDPFATRQSIESVVNRLIEKKPELVGISCLTPAYPFSRTIVERYRNKGGEGLVIMGGVHATCFHREIIADNACDIVVRREGEGSFDALLEALETDRYLEAVRGITYRQDDRILVNADHPMIEDLDSLPAPAWERLTDGFDHYADVPSLGLYGLTLPILGSRGCPMRCTFCGQEVLYDGVRKRSVENLMAEIRYLKDRFDMKNFVLLDANFPLGRKYGHDFCDAMIESGLNRELAWSVEVAVHFVDRKFIQKLAQAGCRNIEYGFEVGDPGILRETQKGTTIEQAIDAMTWTREAGIHTLGLFMIGLPGETPRHALKTLRLAMKLDCNIAKFNITIPYPGSLLFERHRDVLLKNFDAETFNPWFESDDPSRKVTVLPGGMPAEQQLFLQRLMMLFYYARPRVLWKHWKKKTLRPTDVVQGAKFLVLGLFSSLGRYLGKALRPAPSIENRTGRT